MNRDIHLLLTRTQQVTQVSFTSYFTMNENRNAVTEVFNILKDVAASERKRFSSLLQFKNNISYIFATHGIESRHGFIENDQLGIVDEGLRQSHPLNHTLGKLAKRSTNGMSQPHSMDQFLCPRLSFSCRHPKELAVEVQEFHRLQMFVEVRVLR